MTEAVGLPDETISFNAANPDIPFSWILVLFQDAAGFPPTGSTAENYWQDIGEPTMPVLADLAVATIDQTGWDGGTIPGKCVLTPEMEMIHCYDGHGNETGYAAIADHWASR